MIAMAKPNHKFFERHLSLDLPKLETSLLSLKERLSSENVPGVKNNDYESVDKASFTTQLGEKYNIFQFHDDNIRALYSSIREMVLEACEYYGIDAKSQNYMIQGWFNADKNSKPEPLPNTYLHDHLNGQGAPDFHGYYCVNAEPSYTKYMISGETEFLNVNVNNRAILSETGHAHGISNWPFEKDRITIAYDVSPLQNMKGSPEQHWVPIL